MGGLLLDCTRAGLGVVFTVTVFEHAGINVDGKGLYPLG
jgi:hypothetical protein